MAKVGAQRAADLTGRSKSTIQRAMNNGKLSFEVDSNGRRVIDVSELDRAFGLKQQSNAPQAASVEAELEKASTMIETERLKMRIRMLEEQLHLAREQVDDLKEQRDKWQKQADQVLITSQFSQKQAEDLREEIKDRERRARERRQIMEEKKAEEQKIRKLKAENENEQTQAESEEEDSESFNFRGLWKKVKTR